MVSSNSTSSIGRYTGFRPESLAVSARMIGTPSPNFSMMKPHFIPRRECQRDNGTGGWSAIHLRYSVHHGFENRPGTVLGKLDPGRLLCCSHLHVFSDEGQGLPYLFIKGTVNSRGIQLIVGVPGEPAIRDCLDVGMGRMASGRGVANSTPSTVGRTGIRHRLRDIVNSCGLEDDVSFPRSSSRIIDLFPVHEYFTRHDEREELEDA
jgi:hypothetical protein